VGGPSVPASTIFTITPAIFSAFATKASSTPLVSIVETTYVAEFMICILWMNEFANNLVFCGCTRRLISIP
jgi:hypothetical protein